MSRARTGKAILFLAVAILLTHPASRSYALDVSDNAAVIHQAEAEGQMGASITTGENGQFSSRVIEDRQPLIRVPIIDGVATPAPPRFELDHAVPSVEILSRQYPHHGRRADIPSEDKPDRHYIVDGKPASDVQDGTNIDSSYSSSTASSEEEGESKFQLEKHPLDEAEKSARKKELQLQHESRLMAEYPSTVAGYYISIPTPAAPSSTVDGQKYEPAALKVNAVDPLPQQQLALGQTSSQNKGEDAAPVPPQHPKAPSTIFPSPPELKHLDRIPHNEGPKALENEVGLDAGEENEDSIYTLLPLKVAINTKQEVSQGDQHNEVLVKAMTDALLDEYRTSAASGLESYELEKEEVGLKSQEQPQEPQSQLQSQPQEKQEHRLNRLNKNHAVFDENGEIQDRSTQPTFSSHPASRGGGANRHIMAHYHHHHVSPSSLKSPLKESLDENEDPEESPTGSNLDLSSILIENEGDKSTSVLAEEQESGPSPASIPDEIKNPGLIPKVLGAHHCVPQFCVNVTVSDDGQFATFHIERPMEATGWVALGIGYAMTTADLIILWPTTTSPENVLERGAVLSRRTSHAYVEPMVVGHQSANPLGDRLSEASLYPPNEYVLHNPTGSGPSALSSSSSSPSIIFSNPKVFIVQFTRPIKTKNPAHKLTPGDEQDFCWAYSPKPVSPDSVLDPAAHISQHMSVGSFAMDVAANQPGLKDVLLKQKAQDLKDEAADKAKKQQDLEAENAILAAEEEERLSNGEGGSEVGALKHSDSIKSGSFSQTSSASDTKWFWVGSRGYQSLLGNPQDERENNDQTGQENTGCSGGQSVAMSDT
ncbi:hypothetical protein BGZ83_007814 [Gryganskiella cystojenkinii]|nr:hypothetical protein BGZ83_007814 [Gryganskiella cystojenkinii]